MAKFASNTQMTKSKSQLSKPLRETLNDKTLEEYGTRLINRANNRDIREAKLACKSESKGAQALRRKRCQIQ